VEITAQLLKYLGDETRLRLALLAYAEGEVCVCELAEALDASQPKISRHLALLRSGKILSDQRRGQWVYYRLHQHLPGWARETIAAIATAQATQLALMQDRLRCFRRTQTCQ
jgi:ArsR family transcriptional regulator